MKKQKFFNKVIWITGASSGIGEACAYQFAQAGAWLILTARSAEKLETVQQKCLQSGGKCNILPFNLEQTTRLADLSQQALAIYGRIDILINNAGVSQRGSVLETEEAVARRIMELNYFAPALLSKYLLPSMIANGGGQFVVVTSIAGRFGFPLRSSYSASKHALYGFFETLQAENYTKNIRVTMVCPGRVYTNISLSAIDGKGIAHGQLDEGQASGISAGKAARRIVKAVYHNKREVLVGGKELLMVYIKRFMPALTARLARKIKST